ncbi:MAG: endonuclease/exonuclease/phosphatase family protein [Siphonobacter sp.]
MALVTYLLVIYVVIGYVFAYTLWYKHWVVGFWLMALPLAMAALLILSVGWFLFRVSRAWLPTAVLFLGWPLWQRTISWHDKPFVTSLRVTTFNVSSFASLRFYEDHTIKPTQQILNWIKKNDADILCMQEFYNWEEDNKPDEFRTVSFLKRLGYRYYSVMQTPETISENIGFLGPALFSKYPIINKRSQFFKVSTTHNGYVIADIKRNQDTIRVISVHLASMGVRVGQIIKEGNSKKAETKDILIKLKNGFEDHVPEIAEIVAEIKKSPYPLILCGDFNEVPTCLSYGSVRRYLNNSFETAGKGLGFTLNRSPYFIRIDNQFYSSHFKATSHTVDRSVKSSDHFPVTVTYDY